MFSYRPFILIGTSYGLITAYDRINTKISNYRRAPAIHALG